MQTFKLPDKYGARSGSPQLQYMVHTCISWIGSSLDVEVHVNRFL